VTRQETGMGRIVEVVHPAFVDHIPQRGSVARATMMRIATPVQVATHPRDAFERAFEMPGPVRGVHTRIMAGPGGLWEFVEALGENPVTEDELVLYLTGELGAGPLREMLQSRFDRTPVAAHGDGSGYGKALVTAFRGVPGDLDRSRRVLHDGRDRARADLAAFFASDVALVGGKLAMRARPLVHVAASEQPSAFMRLGIVMPRLGLIPCTPGTLEQVSRICNRPFRETRALDPDTIAEWATARAGEDALDDVRWALNALAGPVREMLVRCAEAGGYALNWQQRIRDMADALRPVEIRALTGRAGEDLAHEVRLLRNGIDRLAVSSAHTIRDEHAPLLKRVMDEVVMPRVDALDLDDVEALSGLAPA
jgi:hypothetical protein